MLASVYCPTVHLGHDLPGHVGPAPAEHTVILQGPVKVRPFSAVAFGANGGVGEGPGGVASVAPRPRKRSVARANIESAWCVCGSLCLPICRIYRICSARFGPVHLIFLSQFINSSQKWSVDDMPKIGYDLRPSPLTPDTTPLFENPASCHECLLSRQPCRTGRQAGFPQPRDCIRAFVREISFEVSIVSDECAAVRSLRGTLLDANLHIVRLKPNHSA